jgi:hypothetical protein
MSETEVKTTALDRLLARLEKRYGDYEVPPCRVCGRELSIGAIGGGERTRWGCNPMIDDPDKPGFLKRDPDWVDKPDPEKWPYGHYSGSVWTAPNFPSHDVLRAVRIIRALQKRLRGSE